ncbi:hypothetical protein Llac01_11880 [Leuconostoc lactis]|nr:hypothetical protein Llac01_11880 [Leuconostoc lactis]
MKNRSVLIFPDFNSVDQATIQSIRQKHDSLYTCSYTKKMDYFYSVRKMKV